jgi:hypothetical protein
MRFLRRGSGGALGFKMSKKKKFDAAIAGIEPYIPGKENFTLGFRSVSVRNIDPPAYVMAFLFLSILKLRNFGEMEKVWWHTYFTYKGIVFLIRDYKFGTWSLEIRSDFEITDSLLRQVLGKVTAAGRQAGKILEGELAIQIQSGEFWIKNNYHSLLASYEFFLEEAESAMDNLRSFIAVPEPQDFDMDAMTARINEQWRLERILGFRCIPLISSFYSLLEFLLDAFFAFEQPSCTFFEFRQLNWQERFKLVAQLEPGSSLLKGYEQIIRIKSEFRNPLTHGLTNESSLLVPAPFGGLVPVSYEHLSNTLHFGMTQISPEVAVQIIGTFKEFLDALERVEPYAFYVRYLAAGFSLPASNKEADRIREEMRDMDTFEEYLENRSRYEDAVTNREI